MADITMPQLGETVTEGTITKWHKAVGEEIKEDDVLFEVSTDKVDSEVPSPVTGVLTQIVANEGDTVPVGSVIAVVDAGSAGAAPAPAAEATPPPAPEPVVETPAAAPVVETPAPAPVVEAPAPAPAPASNGATAPLNTEGRVLSPVVRKLIGEYGLNAGDIPGSGAGGRITRKDVENIIAARGLTPAVTPAAPPPPPSAPAPAAPAQPASAPVAPPAAPAAPVTSAAPIPAPAPAKGDTVIPMTNIRRKTAEHMIRSKATSAHTLIVIDVDYNNVDRVRLAQKSAFKAEEGVNLTYLPFIARAVCDALREFTTLNASVGNDELIIHNDVNLGFAVDMNFEGLIVPVVKQADAKRLRALAREVADLADRARSKKLGTDEISGGTFTITNAGGYGTFVTYPVINQPQIGILSTDGVKKRPVVVELPDGTDAIAIHPVGNLALAWDHRAVDGAYAAAFMARVKEILETRNWAEEF